MINKLVMSIAIGLALSLTYVLVSEGLGQSIDKFRVGQLEAVTVPAYQASRDPKPATSLAKLVPKQYIVQEKDIPRISDEKRKPILVVYAGTCTECSLKTLKPTDIVAQRYKHVVFIYQGKAPEKSLQFPAKFSVFYDVNSHYAQLLNVSWYPRFFVLDSTGKLMRAQKPNDPVQMFGVRQ